MRLKMFVRRNSSTILTVLGSVGVVATAYATARATPKAMRLLKEAEEENGEELTVCEKIIVSAPIYLPAAILGITTITCVFSANMLNHRNQATIQSAYALLDQTYKDYRRKCKELYGEEADHRIIEALKKGEPETLERDQSWISAVISKIHKSPISRIRTRHADARVADLRAKGYQKKGNYKEDMAKIKLLSRTTDPQTIYIKDL